MSVQMYDPRQHPVREAVRKTRVNRWWMKRAARANDRGQRWLFALMRPLKAYRDRAWYRNVKGHDA